MLLQTIVHVCMDAACHAREIPIGSKHAYLVLKEGVWLFLAVAM